jgi:uracil-DNA glycosylase family 4
MKGALTQADTPREALHKMIASLRTRLQLDMELNRAIPASFLKKGDPVKKARVLASDRPQGKSADRPGQTLPDVRDALGDCRRCPLCETRTNLVFGEGNARAGLVFVGEAPGADEDSQGRPFVGKAGQLLTRIIVAMGLQRQDVYICNILKCRPPDNRNPRPEEIAACEPFLIRQLQAIRPKMICALGTFSAHTLLKTDVPISLLRGRFHSYQGIPLMPTYHPAYLLRNPAAKKQVWEDVQQIMKALELR